jgi:hypothetical protein
MINTDYTGGQQRVKQFSLKYAGFSRRGREFCLWPVTAPVARQG